ncbi:hypothetical protein [Falsiroseomonas selenitidurans]|uniref:Uncharacterized protein n=1 Tax=Falsiroseomonas selenitidurans TaxID=2716335 RepID=A0ABX1E9I5_9PROT|nr:hypothetical protein [Falsiroseomonas selenitidurans]NKC31585.1 hypothetical protein [Falsiroseomonas selenitidurans]
MTRFNRFATALFAAGALGFAVPALAEDGFPRVVGSGENASVEYGAAPQQNIVGGGRVTVREDADGSVQLRHADDRYAQPGRQGVQAVTVGSGENTRTVWVPAGTDAATAQRLANGFQG